MIRRRFYIVRFRFGEKQFETNDVSDSDDRRPLFLVVVTACRASRWWHETRLIGLAHWWTDNDRAEAGGKGNQLFGCQAGHALEHRLDAARGEHS